jgi:hypothetical protein
MKQFFKVKYVIFTLVVLLILGLQVYSIYSIKYLEGKCKNAYLNINDEFDSINSDNSNIINEIDDLGFTIDGIDSTTEEINDKLDY